MGVRTEAPLAAEGATQETRHAGSAPAPSLPARLAEHAASTPERPFLFYPDGLDMRWRSYRTVAAQAAAGAEALSALGLAAGARVAFRWHSGPDAVAADLAIQGAGLTAVPLGETGGGGKAGGGDREAAASVEAGCAARLALPGEPALLGLPGARLPDASPGWGRAGRRAAGPGSWPPGDAGAALVRVADAGAGWSWRVQDQEAQRAAARVLAGRVAACLEAVAPARARSKERREVALAVFDPGEPDGRAVLTWALEGGAALVLEPDARSLGGVAAWARPTLVAGPLRGLAALEQAARRLEEDGPVRRWLRGLRRATGAAPFGRLRTVVLLGPGRMGSAALSFWLARGVGVVRAG